MEIKHPRWPALFTNFLLRRRYHPQLTALRSVGLLDVLHEYDCAGLGRDALSARRYRRLATKAYE